MSYTSKPFPAATPQPASGQKKVLSALSSSPQDCALFLDIDGTLLDLAEVPDAIVVPPLLPAGLDVASQRLGGALALVTGRALAYADELFSPFRFPIAGLHGAELRRPDGKVAKAETTAAFEALKADLRKETEGLEGVLVEDKGAAVAAHYRLAPHKQAQVEPIMERMLSRAGPNWTLQRGKMVLELRPASADKGHAVEAFLSMPPFAGRRPITIGDDVTDEAMFRIANRQGGLSVRVGAPSETAAALTLPSASAVRELIGQFAV
ncbi:trehalose-phosphatase [Rhizobium grahamii]|uniref:Trehalose 6-phosphate phosphatase n=1 Tax=Rhizobium grahamii CCGE 502 TaxID=990285 RepID=S3HPY9_9HYPH|nr:trehalose-phosphatase [Rhizobium grahamii]EPE99980.1 HAD family hydrolase [Rhizobium grahamii CCGE 502]